MSNDTRETNINNNDLIIGPSGAGKTRGYVMPNIMQSNESMVIVDTKGNLQRKTSKLLKKKGYEVCTVDFINPEKSIGYNPLEYIRRDKNTGKYSETDICKLANSLCPVVSTRDPFWEISAQTFLCCFIAFVLETNPEEPKIENIMQIFRLWNKDIYKRLFTELEAENPESFAVNKYKEIDNVFDAERTASCIKQFVANSVRYFNFSEINKMVNNKNSIDFKDLGKRKTALFVNVSDTDRSMDYFAKVFYEQLFQALCDSADRDLENSRLKVPVRIILDDFASNVKIEDFDKIISIIRSREISVSLMLQSISQIQGLYTDKTAETIINNCDNIL